MPKPRGIGIDRAYARGLDKDDSYPLYDFHSRFTGARNPIGFFVSMLATYIDRAEQWQPGVAAGEAE